MEWRVTSPREAALAMLSPRIAPGKAAPVETTVDLADFQRAGVEQAQRIIGERGGVLVADSVGLGKTYVALALIEMAIREGKRVLLVCPAGLRRMWRVELAKHDVELRLITHSALALHPPGQAFDLVVVDEAHAFRNPATRRHRALRRVCRHARVLLLTATPVNNSLADLYFLLRLWMPDSGLRDVGIGSIRAALLASEPRPTDLERIRKALIVRRTRAEVRAAATDRFRFPARVDTIKCAYTLAVPVTAIAGHLNDLRFSAYGLDRPGFSPELMRYSLLKRMESSVAAIRSTLRRQIRFHEEFIAANARGLLLRPSSFRSLYEAGDDSLQLVLEEVALPPAFVLDVGSCREDLRVLRAWFDSLRNVPDEKLAQLTSLLRSRPMDARTVIFTEFRDTARYLWSALRRRFATGLIDGAGAWIGEAPASRRQVVDRFAPIANEARGVHPRESIRVLIATDVLAEGMNLQDADAVVSYDLPWNPVRLIQRAGRVDRIGSQHDVVKVYNFIPDREFDALLGLAKTIRGKLETVRGSVGLERPVLEPDEELGALAGAPFTSLNPGAAADTADKALPIAAIPGACGRTFVVGLQNRGVIEIVCFVDGQKTGPVGTELLTAALAERTVTAVRECLVASLAPTLVALVNAPGPRVATAAGPAARAARLLRKLTGDQPLLHADPDFYARVDSMLERLSGTLEIAAEEDLETLCRCRWHSPAEMVTAMEKVLAQAAISHDQDAPWTITGVLIVD